MTTSLRITVEKRHSRERGLGFRVLIIFLLEGRVFYVLRIKFGLFSGLVHIVPNGPKRIIIKKMIFFFLICRLFLFY